MLCNDGLSLKRGRCGSGCLKYPTQTSLVFSLRRHYHGAFFFPPCFANRTAGTDYFSRVSWRLTVTLYVVIVGYWFVLVFFYRSLFQTNCYFSCCLFLCFFVFNWSLDLFDAISTLQMLTNIENRLEELFEQIEVMPPDRVEMAEKVRGLFRTTIIGTQ